MKYFLQEAAKDVYSRYSGELENICVVFPNRRSGVFFRYYLANALNKPSWSPEITTISDLMQNLSGFQKADNLSLVFMLYEIFSKEKKNKESFDEFYFWGEMLLRDFDDLDKYLVEPRDLFQNLASLKSIEDKFSYLTEEQLHAIQRFWDTIDMNRLSGEQKDFVSVWEVLYKVYFQFNSQLDELKQAYEGKIYRTVMDKLNSGTLETPSEKYIFIGFNALTPAERKFFTYLKNNNLADFYWDYDEYYLKSNEAGRFILQNIKDFPGPELKIYNNYIEKKNIRYINTSYDVAQAKIIPELLSKEQQQSDKPNKSAIILPDEHLLLPVLNSIPGEFEKVNVTMGYPVYLTPAYSLLLSLISLRQNTRKKEEDIYFYYKDVLSVLNHQYLGILKNPKTEAKLSEIRKHNKVYVSMKEMKLGGIFDKVFQAPEDYSSLSDYLMDTYYGFYQSLKSKTGEGDRSLQLELECIYHVYVAIKRLKEIFNNQKVTVKVETYLKILERVIQNQSIPFKGEPLSGLQVMGILETRTLDFETLIVLSMNEGIFPKAENGSTFIPYNLRKGFGLPTYEHNDAIYAYYFYRLLQRAKNITMVYNSGTEGVQTGEMSRFMQQLKFESGHPVEEKTLVSDISVPESKPVRIEKTKDVLEKLDKYNTLGKGDMKLSPSGLNTYLRCSLQFYFKYVAGLKEPEELDEDIDLRLFGLLFHKSIELIYSEYKKSKLQVTEQEIDKILQNRTGIENQVVEAFSQEYFTGVEKNKIEFSGKNLLIRDILLRYIIQFLKVEKKFTPFTIIDLEKEYTTHIPFETGGNKKQVTLRGTIDRVDKNRDGARIIDYKSGNPKQTFNGVESLFQSSGNHAALQALLYSRMYAESTGTSTDIVPGLYFIRNLYQNFDYRIRMNRKNFVYSDVKEELDEYLNNLLVEIFNPDLPFEQTEDENICRTCPYQQICRRG